MPGETHVHQPPVEWAQRKDQLFVTVRVEDCKHPSIEITNDKLVIKGVGGADKQEFICDLEFFKEINGDKVRRMLSDRCMQFNIPKKESGPFWPRLLKSSSKVHWLKIDFNKWKDEDDESDVENANNWDLNDMMGKMGGLGGDEKPDLGDFDDDSDNEELPDLEDDKDDAATGSSGEHSAKDKKDDEEAEKKTANGENVMT